MGRAFDTSDFWDNYQSIDSVNAIRDKFGLPPIKAAVKKEEVQEYSRKLRPVKEEE